MNKVGRLSQLASVAHVLRDAVTAWGTHLAAFSVWICPSEAEVLIERPTDLFDVVIASQRQLLQQWGDVVGQVLRSGVSADPSN